MWSIIARSLGMSESSTMDYFKYQRARSPTLLV